MLHINKMILNDAKSNLVAKDNNKITLLNLLTPSTFYCIHKG